MELETAAILFAFAARSNAWDLRTTFALDNGTGSPHATIVNLLDQIAKDKKAVLIRPEDFMCREGLCPYVDDRGDPIHGNSNHLRQSYVHSDSLLWLT